MISKSGRGTAYAGRGRDYIDMSDHAGDDLADGGPARDTCVLDGDDIGISCEN